MGAEENKAVSKNMTIEQVLALCPKALYTFVRYGIEPCGCGEELRIEEIAEMQGVDLTALLAELDRRLAGETIRDRIVTSRSGETKENDVNAPLIND